MTARIASSATAQRAAARVAAVYAVAAAAWIIVSDLLLDRLAVSESGVLALGIAKGLCFVGLTMVLLFLGLRNALGKAASARLAAERLAQQLRFALGAAQGACWTCELPPHAQRLEDALLHISVDFERLLGIEPAAAIEDFDRWRALLHPEDADATIAQARDAILGGAQELELRCRARRSDGAWLSILVRGRPEPGGGAWLGVLLDVTEHQRSQQRLALLGSLFDTASEGFLIADAAATVIACNPAAARLFSRPDADVLGTGLDEVLFLSQPPVRRKDIWATVAEAGSWQGEISLAREDGRKAQLSLRLSVVRDPLGPPQHYAALIFDVTGIEQARQRIRELQDFDARTGLPTARLFLQRLRDALERRSKRARPHAVDLIVFDVLHFQSINEAYGRAAGDQVLQHIAERLRGIAVPASPIARIGANSFALGQHDDDPDDRSTAASVTALRAVLEPPIEIDGRMLYLDYVFGSSRFPDDADSADVLLLHAQTALQNAKRQGRGTHLAFDEQLGSRIQERLRMVAELRGALDRGDLLCFFQPKIRLSDGRVVGAEALLRWRWQGEVLLPGRFLADAEAAGLLAPIGAWMLHAALWQICDWQQRSLLPDGFRVGVNVGQPQITGALAPTVMRAISEQGLSPSALELEFTEDIVEDSWAVAEPVIRQLREGGVSVALDDFGTGNSSLLRLKHLTVDTIKIDQSFVQDLDSPRSRAIVSGIVALGRDLGCQTTAEGVETDAQRECLVELGCHYAQGFLFSPAVDAETFSARHLLPQLPARR